MTSKNDGWSLPSMAKVGVVGVLCFVLLYLIGAIPHLKSPISEIKDAIADTRKVIWAHDRKHDRSMGTMIELQRMICRGTWKGNDEMQRTCEQVGKNGPAENGNGS